MKNFLSQIPNMKSSAIVIILLYFISIVQQFSRFGIGVDGRGGGEAGGHGGEGHGEGTGGGAGGADEANGAADDAKGNGGGGGGGSNGGTESATAPKTYSYNIYYYHYYYYYHGHGSNEVKGPDEPDLPVATAQDIADAVNIVNSQFSEKVIASILPFRDQIHRQVINIEIANHNHGQRLIPPKYLPYHEKNTIFTDLCFGLVNDPVKVLAMYLGEFLHRKDETFIIICLTLCQEMGALHHIYDHNHKRSLTKRRKKQRHPFSNLMRVWILRDRDSEDITFTPQQINNVAESLKKEYPRWKKFRNWIENVLIKKNFQFGLAVIQKFETDLNIKIEFAIKQKIKNHDLVDAYTSLALYVKDKYNYMATIMLKHSDGTDRWAVWIMMVGITIPDDWPKINDAFKNINNGVSLTDHILKTTETDRIPFEMMAAMIDSKYKPHYS